jgi:hypothetical protein
MSVVALNRMGVPAGDEEAAFWLWMIVHYPQWFIPPVGKEPLPAKTIANVLNVNKSQFFEAFLLSKRKGTGMVLPMETKTKT